MDLDELLYFNDSLFKNDDKDRLIKIKLLKEVTNGQIQPLWQNFGFIVLDFLCAPNF